MNLMDTLNPSFKPDLTKAKRVSFKSPEDIKADQLAKIEKAEKKEQYRQQVIYRMRLHRWKKKREAEGKKNTAVDERYLKMTENMLYSELAFALKKDKDEIYDIISTSIGDNQRNLVSRRIRIMNRTFHLLVYYNK